MPVKKTKKYANPDSEDYPKYALLSNPVQSHNENSGRFGGAVLHGGNMVQYNEWGQVEEMDAPERAHGPKAEAAWGSACLGLYASRDAAEYAAQEYMESGYKHGVVLVELLTLLRPIVTTERINLARTTQETKVEDEPVPVNA